MEGVKKNWVLFSFKNSLTCFKSDRIVVGMVLGGEGTYEKGSVSEKANNKQNHLLSFKKVLLVYIEKEYGKKSQFMT